MTNQDSTYSKLTLLLREVFDDDSIVARPELTANDIENWDSVANINLMLAVESRFNIRLTTAEFEKFETVGDLATVIDRKLAS